MHEALTEDMTPPATPEYAALAAADDLWRHWGFVPWTHVGMAGVSRRVTISKGALLGEVARYYADDYIVWTHQGASDCQAILDTWRPAPDVMLHRFVFVMDEVTRPVASRSFRFGFKGYLEVYQYVIGGTYPRKLKDLAPLIDQGWEKAHKDTGR